MNNQVYFNRAMARYNDQDASPEVIEKRLNAAGTAIAAFIIVVFAGMIFG